MDKLNILVVDDSLVTLKKLTMIVEQIGHQVVRTAGTGAEALQAYRECHPDLVTMDITMPDMDGVEATRRIMAEFRDARIVMVTSHAQRNMVLDALDAGATGYVIKPVRAEKLQEIIDRVFQYRP